MNPSFCRDLPLPMPEYGGMRRAFMQLHDKIEKNSVEVITITQRIINTDIKQPACGQSV